VVTDGVRNPADDGGELLIARAYVVQLVQQPLGALFLGFRGQGQRRTTLDPVPDQRPENRSSAASCCDSSMTSRSAVRLRSVGLPDGIPAPPVSSLRSRKIRW
jgi:hypothetical protein